MVKEYDLFEGDDIRFVDDNVALLYPYDWLHSSGISLRVRIANFVIKHTIVKSTAAGGGRR